MNRNYSSAVSAASGARSRIRSNAFAGPAGSRLPCSQLRTVSSGTPIRVAKAAWVSPVLRRTRRAYAAASRHNSWSSSAAWRAISASVVPSTRAPSTRPFSGTRTSVSVRIKEPSRSRVACTRFLALNLSLIGLARRDDAKPLAAVRVNDHEHPSLHATQHPTTVLAVIETVITFDQSARVEKNPHRKGEVEAALGKTGIAFRLIPFELRMTNVGQRTSYANNSVFLNAGKDAPR